VIKLENKKIIIPIILTLLVVLFIAINNHNNEEFHVEENSVITITSGESNENTLVEEEIVEKIESISPELKVYFFDVGQGDSIFVQNGDECMLIDAGNNPDGKYISKYLRKTLGIEKINYLIGTHSHEDHIGGMDIIIEDFDIGTFYMPDSTATNKTYKDVISWANKKNLQIESPKIGATFKVGKAECEIMEKKDNSEDENENSIIVELRFGNQKYLFTADMEVANEISRKWNDIDVLKVAHHGSTYTSSMDFLKEVTPEIAIITCGKDNEYYYPHEAVLKRLKEVGCDNIYITAELGTILITSDGLSNKVDSFREPMFDGNN